MPYIKEENRQSLDICIENMIECLKSNVQPTIDNPRNKLSQEGVLSIIGDINYTFSRISAGIMGDVSYAKIALITGVLENIKQEFYRRVAENYEDQKILQNGDIREYKLLK
jgi:hypothetical protein